MQMLFIAPLSTHTKNRSHNVDRLHDWFDRTASLVSYVPNPPLPVSTSRRPVSAGLATRFDALLLDLPVVRIAAVGARDVEAPPAGRTVRQQSRNQELDPISPEAAETAEGSRGRTIHVAYQKVLPITTPMPAVTALALVHRQGVSKVRLTKSDRQVEDKVLPEHLRAHGTR